MAFTASTYSAQFAYRLLDNLQTYIEASTATALAAIDSTLDDFVEYRQPLPVTTVFPSLFITTGGSQMVQSDDDAAIKSQHEFFIDIAIVGKDAYTLERSMLKYALCIDQVCRTMTVADLITAVSATVAEPIWEVTDWQFSALGQRDTIYRKDARVVLTVQMMER